MLFPAIFSFLVSGFLWGVAIHLVRWAVDREGPRTFTGSIYLGFGIKVAAWLIVALLGGLLGPFILAPVFFATWAILARYGKLSELQAMAGVGALIALDLVWTLAGLS